MGVQQCTLKLYISRSWQFNNAFEQLERLLSGHCINHDITYQMAPSPAYKGRQRFELIKEKISGCDAVLILCGVYRGYSDWISKEIVACKQDRHIPIIAIDRYNDRNKSPLVIRHANRIVKWNAELILSAIRELADPI
ncbi:TIR-like protein DUF1863 [Paenibacillus taihuensis]|uniref:TIR-like protein DUF1863 n=1 Tax=Paenibacillus taihuensis TaxID=1156355 RepID=A0A3D9SH04_9BACL|nr:TIR domain-containing protein [Paenibacillus taihuensis]REE91565.1 TIR-like protein DUF1863 [Paenibacillus taihuensis]